MSTETDMILEQLRELRSDLKAMRVEWAAQMEATRADQRATMIEMGAMKARLTTYATVAAVIAAAVAQFIGQSFFR